MLIHRRYLPTDLYHSDQSNPSVRFHNLPVGPYRFILTLMGQPRQPPKAAAARHRSMEDCVCDECERTEARPWPLFVVDLGDGILRCAKCLAAVSSFHSATFRLRTTTREMDGNASIGSHP